MSNDNKMNENSKESLFKIYKESLEGVKKDKCKSMRKAGNDSDKFDIDCIEKSYCEMAKLNLEFSNLEFEDSIKDYETWLSESDLSDDNDSKKRRHLLC